MTGWGIGGRSMFCNCKEVNKLRHFMGYRGYSKCKFCREKENRERERQRERERERQRQLEITRENSRRKREAQRRKKEEEQRLKDIQDENDRIARENERLRKQQEENNRELLRIQRENARIQRENQKKMDEMKKQNIISQRSSIQSQLAVYTSNLNEKSALLKHKKQELEPIRLKKETEEKEIEAFLPIRNDPNAYSIKAIGKTGVGKSTFSNRFCGDSSEDGDEGDFKVGEGAESQTTSMKTAIKTYNNKKYCIIDTPGANDTENRDRQFTNMLIKYVKGCGGINSFLIFIAISDRFDSTYQQLLKEYQDRMGGISFWKHVIIVITKGDFLNQKKREKKVKSLLETMRKKLELSKLDDNDNEFKLKYVVIGHDNYEEAIKNLLEQVNDTKYQCNAMISPYDDLLKQYNELNSEVEKLENKVNGIQSQVNNCNNQINSLTQQINRL